MNWLLKILAWSAASAVTSSGALLIGATHIGLVVWR